MAEDNAHFGRRFDQHFQVVDMLTPPTGIVKDFQEEQKKFEKSQRRQKGTCKQCRLRKIRWHGEWSHLWGCGGSRCAQRTNSAVA